MTMSNRLAEIHSHRAPFYVYRITFLDPESDLYGATYYGQHKLQKGENALNWYGHKYYHGSSVIAHKEYWPYYNLHIKEILEHCYSEEEANEKEKYWINYGKEHDKNCINSDHNSYTRSHEKRSEAMKKRWQDEDYRTNLVNKFKNREFTEIHKLKLKLNHADRWKENNPVYNKICINKDGHNKFVRPEDIDKYLSDGWLKGMIKKSNLNK